MKLNLFGSQFLVGVLSLGAAMAATTALGGPWDRSGQNREIPREDLEDELEDFYTMTQEEADQNQSNGDRLDIRFLGNQPDTDED